MLPEPASTTPPSDANAPHAIAPSEKPIVSWLVETLVDSYGAYARYEHLRHMSDASLHHLGIEREDVARRMFAELHTEPKH
jgi:hypothetical protein